MYVSSILGRRGCIIVHLHPCEWCALCPPLHTPTHRHTLAPKHGHTPQAYTHARAHACGRAAYEYACPKSMPKNSRDATPRPCVCKRERERECVCVCACCGNHITCPPPAPPLSLPLPFSSLPLSLSPGSRCMPRFCPSYNLPFLPLFPSLALLRQTRLTSMTPCCRRRLPEAP